MCLTIFRTYKIALPPQTKPRKGGGLRHLPPSPFTGQFFKKSRHLGFAVFLDIWSMVATKVFLLTIFSKILLVLYFFRANMNLEARSVCELIFRGP